MWTWETFSLLIHRHQRRSTSKGLTYEHRQHADSLAQAAINGIRAFKDRIKTITFDNGLEFSEHEEIAAPYLLLVVAFPKHTIYKVVQLPF